LLELRAVDEDGKSGAEAVRDGRRVGRLVGEPREPAPSRGPHVWVGLDDHELAEGVAPELLADLYAAAGDPWVRAGLLSHFVVSPADEARLQIWFALGFGQEQVHAERDTSVGAPASREGVEVRRAELDDLETLLDLGRTIYQHQVGPPVWSGVTVPGRDESRDEWAEFVADDVVYLAFLDGEPVGYAGLYAVEDGAIELSVAGTTPAARGRGVGSGLVERALSDAHADGFRTCRLDYRSTNLLASRFWRSHGFRPTHVRLRRDVQPYA
jgi:ribosomal protein S18 acetylase RimI-like enzyme